MRCGRRYFWASVQLAGGMSSLSGGDVSYWIAMVGDAVLLKEKKEEIKKTRKYRKQGNKEKKK